MLCRMLETSARDNRNSPGSGRNGSPEQYGLDRIKQLLKEATISDPQSLCASVLNSVAEFSGHAPACDDRTALALVRTG